ncbi:MAG: hypothetical protein LBN08_02935 [Lactobacillales bacterium]|jgi:hypothetical protein|nr:hypothetical protein [Lactobacillales bacterium]
MKKAIQSLLLLVAAVATLAIANQAQAASHADLTAKTSNVLDQFTTVDNDDPSLQYLPPQYTVSFSSTKPTNDSVVATIKTNIPVVTPEGWTQVDSQTFTRVYEDNIVDGVVLSNAKAPSMITLANVEINWFDFWAPTATVSFDSEITDGSVTVTMETNESVPEPMGWTKVTDKKFTRVYNRNGGFEYTFGDWAGNPGVVSFEINNIQPLATDVTYAYNTNDNTETATLKTNIKIAQPYGWTKVDDKTFTYVYSDNVEEFVNVLTTTGTRVQVPIEIDQIDHTAPTGGLFYSTTDSTFGSVTVTLLTNEPIKTPKGWNYLTPQIFQLHVSANIPFYDVILDDNHGNVSTLNLSVNNIYLPLSASVSYAPAQQNQVTAIVTTTRAAIAPEGWTQVDSTTFAKTYNDNVTENVTFTTEDGVSATVEVVSSGLDRTAPIVKVASRVKTGPNSVEVTVEANEPIKTPTGFAAVSATTFTRTYNLGYRGYISFEDLSGNKSTPLFINTAGL